MQSIDRVRNTIAGKPVDHLAVQPMSMMFSSANAGCEISPLTPPENLRAMIAYARDHKPDDFT